MLTNNLKTQVFWYFACWGTFKILYITRQKSHSEKHALKEHKFTTGARMPT